MLSLEMVQIKGIFRRTTGWSKWAIRPISKQEPQVIFPPHEEIVTLADRHFGPGARCSIHENSEKGHWWNTVILDIPSGTSPDERRVFVEELEPLTNVRPR